MALATYKNPMNRVVHFEIMADDPDRAQKFYEACFGWTFQKMGEEFGGYRVIMTGPGPDEMAKGVKMEDIGIIAARFEFSTHTTKSPAWVDIFTLSR